mgnify:CR=1 FL=1
MKIMRRSRAIQFAVLIWLAVVYVWLWGVISVANIVSGLVIGALIMFALPLPRVPVAGRVHPLSIVVLLGSIVYYALESSLQIAWLAIRPKAPPITGVLRVRMEIKSDMVLVLFCDTLNLIPGTMVLEIDKDRRLVYVHVLDVGSDAAVNTFYRSTHRLERLFISAFERDVEWEGTS